MTQNESTTGTEAREPDLAEAGAAAATGEAAAPATPQTEGAAAPKKRTRAPRKRATSPAKAPVEKSAEPPATEAAQQAVAIDAAAEDVRAAEDAQLAAEPGPSTEGPDAEEEAGLAAAEALVAAEIAAAAAAAAPAPRRSRRATRATGTAVAPSAEAPASTTPAAEAPPAATEPAPSETSAETQAEASAADEAGGTPAAESRPTRSRRSRSGRSRAAAAAPAETPADGSGRTADASIASSPEGSGGDPAPAEVPDVLASVEASPAEAPPLEVAPAQAAPKRSRRAAAAPAMPLFQAPPAEEAPRRSRRAASRPAGPPQHGDAGEISEAGEPSAGVETAEAVTTTTEPAGPPAAGEGTTSERPRRNRSRRSGRPAAAPAESDESTPEAAEVAGLAAAVTGSSAEEQVADDLDERPEARDVENQDVENRDVENQDVEDRDADELDGEEQGEDDGEDQDASADGPRRRRRRGGRGRRGRGREQGDRDEDGETTEGIAETPAAADEDQDEDEDGAEPDDVETSESGATSGGSSRRRRRRRRGGGGGGENEASPDDPPNTVVRVREPRSNDVTGVKGSTRLEAKKQRRREGRDAGRRKNVITEAEFLARRESVERTMLVRQLEGRTQIAVLEDDVLVEHYVARQTQTSTVGNVYLGKVQNVLPSMEAAFVDIGKGRNAVLYAGEVNWDAAGLDGQPRRIEHALKAGESVLVQVTKDPIGHKGARLTSQISLAGRYLVYVPDGSMTGISRKLPDTERARLKKILKAVVPEDAGVIVRTAAEGASEEELERDVQRLQGQWEEIQAKSKNRSTGGAVLLHGEPDLAIRVVRDIFNEDFGTLVISGEEAWEQLNSYIGSVAPHLADRISRWEGEKDVFHAHRVDEQLAKGLDRKVWLPSGGSLVIDRTEAMTVVDVNTGKFTGSGGNLEETVTRNNLEAAEEVVRQLRLRDIGGIIVVDFIDMVLEANRDLVQRRLMECLGRDRTRHQVAEVTSLGLIQMTRKRVGQGLLEVFSETCEHCNGRGVVIHDEPVEKKQSTNGGGNGGGGGNGTSGGGSSNGGGNGASGNGGGRKRNRKGSSGTSGESEAAPPPVVRNPDAISQIAAVAGAGAGAAPAS